MKLKSILIFLIKLVILAGMLFFQIKFPNLNQQLGLPIRLPQAIFLFFISHLVFDFIRMTLVAFYLRKHELPSNTRDNFTIGTRQLALIVDSVTFLFSGLVLFDIDISQALTAISIVAAAIAILSKDYVSNMINGLILMFANQISINDYVKIGENKGNVIDMNLINLHILNDDDDLIFIPNSVVLTTMVVNYTKRAINRVSIEFETSITNLKNIEALESALIAGLENYKTLILEDSYSLRAREIKKDAAIMKFQFILTSGTSNVLALEREIRRQVNRKIVEYLDDNNV
ncbi:MAG: mechanosensitive ion channel [Bacteroidia bacterium]|nr:mechanosensitive ion channel [Bacteroidia bacterium]